MSDLFYVRNRADSAGQAETAQHQTQSDSLADR